MTDPHCASSIFPSFPRPFLCFPTRESLLHVCQREQITPFTVISPLHGGASFGIGWWQDFIHGCAMPSILDCGANAAMAIEALNAGIDAVICRDFRPHLTEDLRHRLATCRPTDVENAPNLQRIQCEQTHSRS